VVVLTAPPPAEAQAPGPGPDSAAPVTTHARCMRGRFASLDPGGAASQTRGNRPRQSLTGPPHRAASRGHPKPPAGSGWHRPGRASASGVVQAASAWGCDQPGRSGGSRPGGPPLQLLRGWAGLGGACRRWGLWPAAVGRCGASAGDGSASAARPVRARAGHRSGANGGPADQGQRWAAQPSPADQPAGGRRSLGSCGHPAGRAGGRGLPAVSTGGRIRRKGRRSGRPPGRQRSRSEPAGDGWGGGSQLHPQALGQQGRGGRLRNRCHGWQPVYERVTIGRADPYGVGKVR